MNWKKLIPSVADIRLIAKFAEFYYAVAIALVIGLLV